MPRPAPSRLLHALPSLADVAFVVPILFVFGKMNGARGLLGDGDTGWHVRTGEWILRHGQAPHRDIFSFSMTGQPWFAWEWLWDVVFAWLHQRGGMAAVVLGSMLVISLTFALLYGVARRRSGNPLIAIGVTVLAAAASTIHWLARPHLVTLLFLVIFYDLLDRLPALSKGARQRVACAVLPALTVLWTNLHGGFVAGVAVILVFAAAEGVRALSAARREDRRAALRLGALYLAAAGACLAASFLNPYFYHLHVHIAQYLTDPYQYQHISEFLSLSFHHPAARYLEAMLLLAGAAAVWQLRRARLADAMLIAAWGHLALVSARNIPIFAILAAPAVAGMLEAWLTELAGARVAPWLRSLAARFQESARGAGALEGIWRLHAASALALGLLAMLFYLPAPAPRFRAEYDPRVYPAQALEVLRRAPAARRVFANDEWGDYLIYQLYPRSKVFVDGRSDFYGRTFEEKYLDVLNVKYDWEQTLRGYGIDTILLPPDAPLAGALKESRRWSLDYDDGVALVFHATGVAPGKGEQVSAAPKSGGENRDRRITKLHPRDLGITNTTAKRS